MINEKMIELLLLTAISRELPYDKENNVLIYKDHKYDVTKLEHRVCSLVEEFLSPYVIDSTPKED